RETQLPGISEACAIRAFATGECESFAALLDGVEETIAIALQSLQGGFIGVHPRGSDPCQNCPVSACESRCSS
ncbi:MAG: hypothetical protein FWE65_03030, partial [Eggerthellaceae bacterium]|nr:hypothetical protein [Eggerthellaceae bacterium]